MPKREDSKISKTELSWPMITAGNLLSIGEDNK